MSLLRPSPLFTDGAVLRHGREIRIFGTGAEDADVRGTLTDADGNILAEASAAVRGGRFEILFPPQRPAEGCALELRAGDERFTARDIAIGEVYLAGGQSNMEMELRNAEEGAGEAASARDRLLRFFNVPRMAPERPGNETLLAETRWHEAAPEFSGGCSAAAFFFGREMRRRHPDMPVGILGCYWGGTSVTCWMDRDTLESLEEGRRFLRAYEEQSGGKTMEVFLKEEEVFRLDLDAWNRKVEAYRKEHPGAEWSETENACGKCPWTPPPGPGSPYRPAGLAESMLRPLAPAGLTAVLFYQGETDAGQTEQYDVLMKAMIGQWRRWFREERLPFLFVQLPMWIDSGAEDHGDWAKLRLAQARVRDTTADTGMICMLDEGEYGNLHPLRKRVVGERLAELACRMLYGNGEESPRAICAERDGGSALVRLTAPLEAGGEAPALLEAAGEDGRFVPAQGVLSGNTLRIRAEGAGAPVRVRYAWTDWSDREKPRGVNGLPLEPFLLETEEKPSKTEESR